MRGGAACAPAYHARSVGGSGRDRANGSLPRIFARRGYGPVRDRRDLLSDNYFSTSRLALKFDYHSLPPYSRILRIHLPLQI